jgi:hypothetical protein
LAKASAVKRFVANTERAIRAGRLAPGGSFSLLDVAEELSVRWPALRARLAPLEREGLLAVGVGGTMTVAPLDARELEAMCRLGRLVLPDMHARASACMDPERAKRFRESLEWIQAPDRYREVGDAEWDQPVEAGAQLWRDVASKVEIQQARLVCVSMQRYQRLGAARLLSDPAGTSFLERELPVAYRGVVSDDPVVVLKHSAKMADHAIEVARHSLRAAEADATARRAFAGKRPLLKLL